MGGRDGGWVVEMVEVSLSVSVYMCVYVYCRQVSGNFLPTADIHVNSGCPQLTDRLF